MLAKLALDGPQPRLALCELLWPDSTPRQAADSLRQRASRLHAIAGEPFIDVGATVALHAALTVDVSTPEALADSVLLASPGLLAGVDLGDHGELDAWLTKARTKVAERCAQVMADRAESLEREGRLHEALTLARRIVEWVPLAELHWRRVMRLHYLRDDRAAAQDAYWRLHALLRDELGARPSSETQQLFQTIETAETPVALARRPIPVSLLRPPVIVGRRQQWAAMVGAWQVPQPFVLMGEAGLGKSRLLEAFVQDQSGLIYDRGRPGDQDSHDALLGRLLLQVKERFSPTASAEVRAELARIRPEFGVPPEADANPALVRHAVEGWLVAAHALGLAAIVVDDLHNVDAASLEVLRWLAACPALTELRLGFASRPAGDGAVGMLLRNWFADSHRPVRIDLHPLTQPELKELLGTLALPSLVPDEFATLLYRHAGGHPLYTLATLQHAVASGAELRELDALVPPESVYALLDARIRELPESVRDLLQVAAIGGADLRVDRAAHLLGTTPLALSDRWALLEAHNVLRGEAFSHDMVHEAALRFVPQGVRQLLHRQWATLLQAEGSVPPARIARHCEEGLRWSDAGRAWHAAAGAARLAGLLAEQSELFERAARCYEKAGDREPRFEALLARLDGLQLRHGDAAVLAALPEVEALAETRLQQLRCRIVRTEALIVLGRVEEAAAEAVRALDDAGEHAEYAVSLRAQLAIALARSGRLDAALESAGHARSEARESGLPSDRLKAANALMFVNWSAGRLADAVEAQREELGAAEVLGDRALAAASEGSLAALLASAGDIAGTYTHAARARTRQDECGLGDNSAQAILNHTVLGAAAAALGRFDEAVDSLQRAWTLAGADAINDVRAKAGITLAGVWFLLGRFDEAHACLDELPETIPAGMRLQALWWQARVAEAEGRSAQRFWVRFDRDAETQSGLPFVHGVLFEASFRGPAAAAIERLVRTRGECESRGLIGVARALRWRELVRWMEMPGAKAMDAALACARDLEPHADAGLSAKCYPPETWLDLSRVWQRVGDARRQVDCVKRARQWLDMALSRLAPERRHAFCGRNAVNRVLLDQ